MEKLLSEGAIKSRDAALKANDKNWLKSEVDFGLVVANDAADAQVQIEWHLQTGIRFLSSNLANTAARHMDCQTYYVTGVYDKAETMRLADLCADYTPIVAPVEATVEAA